MTNKVASCDSHDENILKTTIIDTNIISNYIYSSYIYNNINNRYHNFILLLLSIFGNNKVIDLVLILFSIKIVFYYNKSRFILLKN